MKNFILPRMYESISINNYFRNLINNNTEVYAIDPMLHISMSKGSFPYHYWNGGERTNNKGEGIFYEGLNELSITRKFNLPIIFNCSNLFINSTDYEDTYSNIILDIFHSGSNYIEVSNLDLLEWIHNKYPFYYFILSERFYLTGQEYINLPDYIKYYNVSAANQDLIDKIKEKNKIILSINQNCFNCEKFGNCDLMMQTAQYNYSEADPLFDCNEFKDNRFKGYTLEQLSQFTKVGITYFYIQDVFLDNQEYFYFLLDYFIKPEKHREVLEGWEKG